MIDGYIDAEGLTFEIRRDNRRKRAAIGKENGDRYYIAVPYGYSRREIEDILRRNVKNALKKIEEHYPPATEHGYVEGALFYLRGEQFPLTLLPSEHAQPKRFGFRDGKFIAVGLDAKEEFLSAFENFYRNRLWGILKEEFSPWCKKIGAGPKRVFLKNVKTRWGSCSTLGNINFNIRLALVPPELMEYVMIHEICHLKEMNHSEKFWKEVRKWCPDYEERRSTLKRDGDKYRWDNR